MWIIIWILLFLFLVWIHEFGHLFAAKKAWVKVKEFGFWIPPRLWVMGKDASGTEYSLNLIPLGGFVRLKWEDPEGEDFEDEDSFISASLPWKLLILAWWIIMNLLFAWLAFSFVFFQWVKPITVIPDNMMRGEVQSYLAPTASFLKESGFLVWEIEEIPAKVVTVFPDSLAEAAGILSDDVLVSINDTEVSNMTLWITLREYFWENIELVISRWEGTLKKFIRCPDENCVLWIWIEPGGEQEVLPIKFWLVDALKAWWQEMVAQSKLTFEVLWSLWKNLLSGNKDKIKKSVENLSGPVWIVKIGDTLLQERGWLVYLAFGGMISLALALFNLLPIPALDWWRALSVVLQSVFRTPLVKHFKIEWYVNLFFFLILMLLGIYIILLDLVRLWWVNIPGVM